MSDVDKVGNLLPCFVYTQDKLYNACLCCPSFLYFLTLQKLHLYFAILDNHDFILTPSKLRDFFVVVFAALSELSLL